MSFSLRSVSYGRNILASAVDPDIGSEFCYVSVKCSAITDRWFSSLMSLVCSDVLVRMWQPEMLCMVSGYVQLNVHVMKQQLSQTFRES